MSCWLSSGFRVRDGGVVGSPPPCSLPLLAQVPELISLSPTETSAIPDIDDFLRGGSMRRTHSRQDSGSGPTGSSKVGGAGNNGCCCSGFRLLGQGCVVGALVCTGILGARGVWGTLCVCVAVCKPGAVVVAVQEGGDGASQQPQTPVDVKPNPRLQVRVGKRRRGCTKERKKRTC